MTTVLIADAYKASMVMSSEIFKDKVPGISVIVAGTGEECLKILQQEKPNMCVVDFDLPDVDGVTLIMAMRELYSGPILLTAYPDEVVNKAVSSDLFAFNDAGGWLSKPVKFDELSQKIDTFLINNQRLGKRFSVGLKSTIVGKGTGRGKRAPKAESELVNLSLGGACIKLLSPIKMKGGQELTLAFNLPKEAPSSKSSKLKPTLKGAVSGRNQRSPSKKATIRQTEEKIRAKVTWTNQFQKTAGLQFLKLSENQKQGLENYLRNIAFSV